MLELIETVTKRAREYVLLRQQGAALDEKHRFDAAMLSELVTFVERADRNAPAARRANHVVTREDAENIRLRRKLTELLDDEEELSTKERGRLTFLNDGTPLSETETAELKRLLRRDRELHRQRTWCRAVIFRTWGYSPLTEVGLKAIDGFVLETDIKGRRLKTAHASALELMQKVYGRSVRAQSVVNSEMEQELLSSTPRVDPTAEEDGLLRFFVGWVLRFGRSPEIADAVVKTLHRETTKNALRGLSRAPPKRPK